MKKRVYAMTAGLIVALGISSTGFAAAEGLTLEQSQVMAKSEPSYQIKIVEDQIKQAKENLDEAMEESVKAAKRSYANKDFYSGLSIQNKRNIYLTPLGLREQIKGLEQELEKLKTSGEDRLESRFYILAEVQAEEKLAGLRLELAKMNQASSKIRYESGSLSLLNFHDASYALLNAERSHFQADLKVQAALEKFNQKLERPLVDGQPLEVIWGSLAMMPKALPEAEVNRLAMGTDAFQSAVVNYQKTVLEIRAIEDGFRGPKFDENRPDAYPQLLLNEIEGVGKVAEALLDSKAAIKEQYAKLQDLNLAVRQDGENLKNRNQEFVHVQGKVESGTGSQKEFLEARIGAEEAALRYNRDRLAYENAVKEWNLDVADWKKNLAVEEDDWTQDLNAYVAAWKYDPEGTMNRIGKAYTDWILSSHGISPSILDSDEE